MTNIEIIRVDYLNPTHAQHLVQMLDAYAQDPMGGGKGLSETVKNVLAHELSQVAGAFSFLCYVDGKPAGVVNCFQGFSTFKSKPLINIHDIGVVSGHRGLGLSQKLLAAVEQEAKERGCCKVTLEVLDKNDVAKNAYKKFGFTGYELDPELGHAVFWEKHI